LALRTLNEALMTLYVRQDAARTHDHQPMISILLIDDDDFQHVILNHMLKSCFDDGYTLESASNLEDALTVLEVKQFDAIFLDNRLVPFRDFRETYPKIRAVANGTATYVISSHIEEPCFQEAKRFGISKVIDKFELKAEISGGLLSR